MVQRIGRQRSVVEVDASVAVDLEVNQTAAGLQVDQTAARGALYQGSSAPL